ncbi:kynurenine 3-monooxygenase [Spinellus fusiger]|nr:kynurenine 3-monooxygenase [Spinellus fusiger]
MDEKHSAVVGIVGAGPVGTINAIYFAQRGWDVYLFEKRADMRLPEQKMSQKGRSINLALSERGLSALRNTHMNLEEVILKSAIPMSARMVHTTSGHQTSQAYSVNGEYINAVDRALLNELLLDAAEKLPNIKICFQHTLKTSNFDNGTLEFEVESCSTNTTYSLDLIVGADGAYSKIRSQMMRVSLMDYSQEYIETGYCELSIPTKVDENGKYAFALDPNHLHIWPRHTFMLIALPNIDFSFTCTLFMPFSMFEAIDSKEKLELFFEEHFPDAIELIGKENLLNDYFINPRGSLINIKTSPHNYKDKAIIIGDAAHAMVPFYGQGMNCGFQDVQVLHEILDQYNVQPVRMLGGDIPNLKEAFNVYSKNHVKDTHAICDLAMYNHYEMRSAVTSVRYLARKKLEGVLHSWFPRLIIPLYTMVSFTTMPYSKAIERTHRQTFWLNIVLGFTLTGTVLTVVGLNMKYQLSPKHISGMIKRAISYVI